MTSAGDQDPVVQLPRRPSFGMSIYCARKPKEKDLALLLPLLKPEMTPSGNNHRYYLCSPGRGHELCLNVGLRVCSIPRGSYPTPFLGYLVLWLGSPI